MKYTLTATCHFGVESVLKREILNLGYPLLGVTDGHVVFEGEQDALIRSNLWLRTAERVQWNVLEFPARSFEELYQGIYAYPWAELLEEDAHFTVNGRSHNSELFSISDCQRITERAIIDKLNQTYKKEYYEKTGSRYVFEISLLNDVATLYLNTSGPGLHRRGYREQQGAAPIKETLAAAMIQLSYWNADRPFLDPFTGSGTIPIEAAMIGKNIAPGSLRRFHCEHFHFMKSSVLKEARQEVKDLMKRGQKLNITGSDYDRRMIMVARENSARISLDRDIFFFTKEVRKVEVSDTYGVIITNPPYGIRLDDGTLDRTYGNFKTLIDTLPTWSIYVITDYPKLAEALGRKPDKNRKLYNGKIQTYFSSFIGPRPPRGDYASV
ncbi:MAG: class I SAM-dependent RNA methyltransferase [Tissierellia bacterium]|nr:class I SAM-dependent RNA methyltransferase [Tissierellia bacterium]